MTKAIKLAAAAALALPVIAGAQGTQQPPPAAAPQQAPAQDSLSQSLGVYAFPAKQQTKEVQNKDEYDCYQWAKQNSGIDPLKPAQPAQQQQAPQKRGGAVRGAAKGAVMGTAVGAISGDTGKGAAIGAVVGGAGGASGQAQANKAAAQQQQQQAQQAAANTKNEFNKAFGACLEGKGYTVK